MNFDIKKPSTWTDLNYHPCYSECTFNKKWYDGDIDKDLPLLSSACSMILELNEIYECEIHVETGGTTVYAELYRDRKLFAELYPSITSSEQRCLYFYLFQHPKVDLRVATAEEAKEVVYKIEHDSDLSEYTDDF